MNPLKVDRTRLNHLTDLPNIGAAMAKSLASIGIYAPGQVAGKDPLQLYLALCAKSGCRQDPCVLDVLISITRFMEGDEPRPWWVYTDERKRHYGQL